MSRVMQFVFIVLITRHVLFVKLLGISLQLIGMTERKRLAYLEILSAEFHLRFKVDLTQH